MPPPNLTGLALLKSLFSPALDPLALWDLSAWSLFANMSQDEGLQADYGYGQDELKVLVNPLSLDKFCSSRHACPLSLGKTLQSS